MNRHDEKVDLSDGKFEAFVQDNRKINDNIKSTIEEYQRRQILKEKDLERRQEDLAEREKELKEIATRIEEAAKAFGLRKNGDQIWRGEEMWSLRSLRN